MQHACVTKDNGYAPIVVDTVLSFCRSTPDHDLSPNMSFAELLT